jgi:diguanylate cyclase (GGDEF)-like protein
MLSMLRGVLEGYDAEELNGRSFAQLVVPAEREKLAAKFGGELGCGAQLSDILSLQRKDGGVTTVFMRGSIEAVENGSCEFRGVMTEAGELAKAIAVLQDEAEKCRVKLSVAEDIVNSLTICAEKDSLTQVLNASTTRRLAEEYLWDADKDCALIIIDIDDFKKINDRYGHMAGDAALIGAAKAIRKLFRSKDIVGRIGGDEFLVLVKDVSAKDIVETRCSQILESFKEIVCEEIPEGGISCSVGAVLSSKENSSYNKLFSAADKAMYKAKSLGKARFVIEG